MKYFLFIDTSSSIAMCALLNNELNICSIKYLSSSFSHSEKLFNLIDSSLKEENITLKDLATIYFVAGPGSFTGLRIAYSVVLGFKRVCELNIKGVNLLDVLLDNLKNFNTDKASIIKASQDEYFFKALSSDNSIIFEEKSATKKEIIDFINSNKSIITINGDTSAFKDLDNLNILDQKFYNLVNPYSMFEVAKLKFYDTPIYLKNAYMR